MVLPNMPATAMAVDIMLGKKKAKANKERGGVSRAIPDAGEGVWVERRFFQNSKTKERVWKLGGVDATEKTSKTATKTQDASGAVRITTTTTTMRNGRLQSSVSADGAVRTVATGDVSVVTVVEEQMRLCDQPTYTAAAAAAFPAVDTCMRWARPASATPPPPPPPPPPSLPQPLWELRALATRFSDAPTMRRRTAAAAPPPPPPPPPVVRTSGTSCGPPPPPPPLPLQQYARTALECWGAPPPPPPPPPVVRTSGTSCAPPPPPPPPPPSAQSHGQRQQAVAANHSVLLALIKGEWVEHRGRHGVVTYVNAATGQRVGDLSAHLSGRAPPPPPPPAWPKRRTGVVPAAPAAKPAVSPSAAHAVLMALLRKEWHEDRSGAEGQIRYVHAATGRVVADLAAELGVSRRRCGGGGGGCAEPPLVRYAGRIPPPPPCSVAIAGSTPPPPPPPPPPLPRAAAGQPACPTMPRMLVLGKLLKGEWAEVKEGGVVRYVDCGTGRRVEGVETRLDGGGSALSCVRTQPVSRRRCFTQRRAGAVEPQAAASRGDVMAALMCLLRGEWREARRAGGTLVYVERGTGRVVGSLAGELRRRRVAGGGGGGGGGGGSSDDGGSGVQAGLPALNLRGVTPPPRSVEDDGADGSSSSSSCCRSSASDSEGESSSGSSDTSESGDDTWELVE